MASVLFIDVFPKRSELIVAVFRREVDGCADAAQVLSAEYEPFEALSRWIERYLDLIMTQRGLAAALHSGEPAYESASAISGGFNEPKSTRGRAECCPAPSCDGSGIISQQGIFIAGYCAGAHWISNLRHRYRIEALVPGANEFSQRTIQLRLSDRHGRPRAGTCGCLARFTSTMGRGVHQARITSATSL